MILTLRNLPNYLLSRGLISHESVVDGELTITDASHRNRAFRVLRGSQPSYFIKQVGQWDPVSIECWEKEDTCYRRLSTFDILPQRYASDRESRILVLELVAGSETLTDYHKRLDSFPIEVGRAQGNALSVLHRTTQGREEPGKIPWILSVHETNPSWYDSLSPANARLLELVQGYPEYCELLTGLRREWQPSCLVHGDVKWDNFLICHAGSPAPTLRLIDWEMAIFGDPCWDAGAVFQAYLNQWIYSMPFHETARPDLLVKGARRPLEQLQPAMRGFWESYASEMGFDKLSWQTMLSRSARCGAARMIQSAYEMMHHWQQMPPAGAAMLQTSFNILARPADAVKELLGFPDE